LVMGVLFALVVAGGAAPGEVALVATVDRSAKAAGTEGALAVEAKMVVMPRLHRHLR